MHDTKIMKTKRVLRVKVNCRSWKMNHMSNNEYLMLTLMVITIKYPLK